MKLNYPRRCIHRLIKSTEKQGNSMKVKVVGSEGGTFLGISNVLVFYLVMVTGVPLVKHTRLMHILHMY